MRRSGTRPRTVVTATGSSGRLRIPTSEEVDRERRGPTERFETIVIGGGQAGLAVGHHLARRGRSFVILEAGDRIGESWRNRWTGLRVFTPARYDGLPGMPFPASPHALPTKDEVADYLAAYARAHGPPDPNRSPRRRSSAQADGGDGFVVTAGRRRFEAKEVVVATGAYSTPRIPDLRA